MRMPKNFAVSLLTILCWSIWRATDPDGLFFPLRISNSDLVGESSRPNWWRLVKRVVIASSEMEIVEVRESAAAYMATSSAYCSTEIDGGMLFVMFDMYIAKSVGLSTAPCKTPLY